ncbi:MAG: hydantoinase/carbamoylase family amidase, partial [Bauldia litoralis]
MSKQEIGGHSENLAIDLDRLRAEMDDLGAIGRIAGVPGINRPGFSDADMEVRAFMADRMKALGMLVSMDAVGNLSGLWQVGEGPAVMAGSHLDTVPMGGFYDGALGVAAAMECVRTLMDANVTPPCPIEVIVTAEEEGRFGGMLGSQALAGAVDPGWLETAVDEGGTRMVDAMTAQGLAPDAYETARRERDSVKAFLELHIEQGPVLESEGVPIGIVEGISGVFKWSVRLSGVANHAGTTPMDLRKDAFVGLVDFARRIPEIIAAVGTDQSRVTIGAVD